MDRFNVAANAIRVPLKGLLDCLCGCSHRRTSFPITLRVDGQQSSRAETYVVCLECGRHFAYDWTTMRMARQPATRAADGWAKIRGGTVLGTP